MPGKAIEIDCSQLEAFIKQVDAAGNGVLKEELKKYLQALGTEFLRVVEDEIIRRNVVDTRLLLNSFHKGSGDNLWLLSEGGLTLEIGTNVKYASYVNDGHWTNPKGGQKRWVPGYWNGGKFVYSPGAETGMLLQQKWVEGAHYWEAAIRIMEQMLPELLERKLAEWLSGYLGM